MKLHRASARGGSKFIPITIGTLQQLCFFEAIEFLKMSGSFVLEIKCNHHHGCLANTGNVTEKTFELPLSERLNMFGVYCRSLTGKLNSN